MSTSYLIFTTTNPQKNAEVMLAILNIAGSGQAFHGSSNEVVSTNLWIVPYGKRDKQELTSMLQKVTSIRSLSVVALSSPIREEELVEVRHLFAQVGLDASNVTDDSLLLFINAKLQGQYTYYIHYDNIGKWPVKIQVKPIKEHPHFSPDWLTARGNAEDEMPDKEFTIDDIEVRSVVIETIEKIEPPPPSPPNRIANG